MEERRRFLRFDTQLKAQYCLEDLDKQWGECTIFNLSRKGMGMKLPHPEEIDKGTAIHVTANVPGELEPLGVKGVVKWIKHEEDHTIGGIELTEVLDEINSLIMMLRG